MYDLMDTPADTHLDTIPADPPEDPPADPATDILPEGPDTPPDPCDDPTVNIYAGTCWESFWEGCWDASGACTVRMEGSTVWTEWENGAYVESHTDSGLTIGSCYNSLGVLCAEVTQSYVMSYSDYVNPTTGESIHVEYLGSENMRFTCPDGSIFYVSAAENERAGDCNPTYSEDCVLL